MGSTTPDNNVLHRSGEAGRFLKSKVYRRRPVNTDVIHLSESVPLDQNDPVHPDNCTSDEQQDARIIWRWAADPSGQYANWLTHEKRLQITVGSLVGRILRNASELPVTLFMPGDVYHMIARKISDTRFEFAGAMTWGDGQTNRMWMSPFECTIEFQNANEESIRKSCAKFGVNDGNDGVVRIAQGIRDNRAETAKMTFIEKPTDDTNWAVIARIGG